jgi:hypothetical protein
VRRQAPIAPGVPIFEKLAARWLMHGLTRGTDASIVLDPAPPLGLLTVNGVLWRGIGRAASLPAREWARKLRGADDGRVA